MNKKAKHMAVTWQYFNRIRYQQINLCTKYWYCLNVYQAQTLCTEKPKKQIKCRLICRVWCDQTRVKANKSHHGSQVASHKLHATTEKMRLNWSIKKHFQK